MKKRFVLVVLFVLVLCSSVVYAQNQFQEVIDLLEDVFQFIGKIFTLPMFRTPKGAFGFLLFLIWVLLVTIFFVGLGIGFDQANQRQRTVIAVILATMVVILINFQRSFMFKLIGNWLIWIYLLLVFGVVALLCFVAWKKVNNHWIKALLYFMALMITLNADDDLIRYLNDLKSAIDSFAFIPLSLIYYTLRKKWQHQQH
ncbi:MAG: hypothetical protein MAG795_00688 [Candidatus Woesearchaeota archaeon]|nr:hypothetical protein [Candidatus Woesearchaeota archaeon]